MDRQDAVKRFLQKPSRTNAKPISSPSRALNSSQCGLASLRPMYVRSSTRPGSLHHACSSSMSLTLLPISEDPAQVMLAVPLTVSLTSSSLKWMAWVQKRLCSSLAPPTARISLTQPSCVRAAWTSSSTSPSPTKARASPSSRRTCASPRSLRTSTWTPSHASPTASRARTSPRSASARASSRFARASSMTLSASERRLPILMPWITTTNMSTLCRRSPKHTLKRP
mmetsp:Transcript_37007/g.91437  ORF Transcript_37007/g.91437 Transcript_37007/m.91437 type:complete len:226 (+) Transcript_37007:1256-1933(+)